MPIIAETEIIHPELGSIRFDDGKHDPNVAGGDDSQPKWVCRPDGWEDDFEIYLPGEGDSPRDLVRAAEALSRREEINLEGRALGDGDIELSWIDLTSEPPSVAFPDNDQVYVLWTGSLNEDWKIENFTQGNW